MSVAIHPHSSSFSTEPHPSDATQHPFFDTIDFGIPNARIYGKDTTDSQRAANEKRLQKAEELKFCPKGLGTVSEYLDKPWVKIAITVSCIAIICWFFPGALTAFSAVALKPLRWLHSLIMNTLAKIPVVGSLTTDAPPIIQLIVGIGTLMGVSYLFDEAAQGAGSSFLTIANDELVYERVGLWILGIIFNPKIWIKDSYHNTIIGMVFAVTVTVPIIEELVFRWIIPTVYEHGVMLFAESFTLITDIDILDESEWFIRKTTAIVSSIIFGAVHFQNDHFNSFVQAIYCGWSGIRLMHPLKDELGLKASCGEHMTNNTVAVTPLVIAYTLTEML